MIEVDCQISINKSGSCFLDPVKTELLQEIIKLGSLRAAAIQLKISYQHAWNMIDEMNRVAPEPMIIKHRGGFKGGGTEISAYGQRILKEYKQIEAMIMKMVSQINAEINL